MQTQGKTAGMPSGWGRVPLSVGSRIISGFGTVMLFMLLLASGLTISLQRSVDLSDAASLSDDLRVEVAVLSVEVQHVDRIQAAFVSSGEPFLYRRTLELGSEVTATGQRMRELASRRPLAAATTERLVRFLDDWVAGLGEATTAGRQEFLQTGRSTDARERFLAVTERVLDFETSERNLHNRVIKEAQQQASTVQALVVAGTVMVTALAALFAIVLSRTIGRRMSLLKVAATSIASGRPYEGHLELRDGGDDLDELARAFELMRRRLAVLAVAEAHRSAELNSVLDAATELAIMGVDAAGVITSFNPGAEKMLGWTSAEMIGRASPTPMLDSAEVAARARELGIPIGPEVLLGRARTGAIDRQLWTYIRKDGTRFVAELTVSPRRDHDGRLMGFLGIARDLTTQRESDAALTAAKVVAEEADRAKSAFLADMSHELRTPLNAILGFSELLTEQLASTLSDRQKRFFSNIQVAGEHLLGLINGVLDLAKVASGQLEVSPDVIDLEPLLEPAIVAARAEAQQAGLTFEYIEDGSGSVRLDAGRTRQILFNLLSNAVKFTMTPGTVKLDVTFDGDALVLSISDSGIGIPAEDASKVFGPFERVNRDRSLAPGTGLGLALTKRLVELQGGTISFESVVGRGTTFTVVLPDARYRMSRSEAILIIEDERTDAELLVAVASEEGLATHRVGTIAEAVDAMRHARPLGVILDLFLPDGHGGAILEALKSSPETTDIPVLVVSSATEYGRFRLMGAECMKKPIDLGRVRAWLRRVTPVAA